MSKNPRDVLTPFQCRVLAQLAKEPLLKDFYLTGGTALAAFYLHHRLSDDLDFFTAVPQNVSRVAAIVPRLARSLGARVSFGRRFETLFECAFLRGRERLEMDFALDMPGRLQPIRSMPGFRLGLDNLLDIACNKVSALYERSEPKDFVDVYFLHKEYGVLSMLLKKTRKKYPDLDDYGFAMAFSKVRGAGPWPRLLKPLKPAQLEDFFMEQAQRLTKIFE